MTSVEHVHDFSMPQHLYTMGNLEMSLLDRKEPADLSRSWQFCIDIEKAINMPEDHIVVEIQKEGDDERIHTVTPADKKSKSPIFEDARVELGEVWPESILTFEVKRGKSRLHPREATIGSTMWRCLDLIQKPRRKMILSDKFGNIILGDDGTPCFLQILLNRQNLPPGMAIPMPVPEVEYPKHVMLLTRGTRGDIQPFVALAIGMANINNWKVTLCTELRYKETIQKVISSIDSARGCVQFRPSGGDTSRKIETNVSKMAMKSTNELMQALMLSRAEAEFFTSEPAAFYWADTLKPDAIVYGFTMTNIAMVISEALQIPMCGFILQPTVIPSKEYTALQSLEGNLVFTTHQMQKKLKRIMEDLPMDQARLSSIRSKHGLRKIRAGTSWDILLKKRSPFVVPINERAFGGKPNDWPASAAFTEFIFLRTAGIQKLEEDYTTFIAKNKEAGRPLVLMAFSSMPVSRVDILKTACMIINECKPSPSVVAMVGTRPTEDIPSSLQARVDSMKQNAYLLEGKNAPFGLLLQQMDINIIHGGLGTTAEAFRAGKPMIVTGILLMDQRFWGMQVNKLGVGPECCHINNFDDHCVAWINQALDPQCSWAQTARELGQQLGNSDGVAENVSEITRILESTDPLCIEKKEKCLSDEEDDEDLSSPRDTQSPLRSMSPTGSKWAVRPKGNKGEAHAESKGESKSDSKADAKELSLSSKTMSMLKVPECRMPKLPSPQKLRSRSPRSPGWLSSPFRRDKEGKEDNSVVEDSETVPRTTSPSTL